VLSYKTHLLFVKFSDPLGHRSSYVCGNISAYLVLFIFPFYISVLSSSFQTYTNQTCQGELKCMWNTFFVNEMIVKNLFCPTFKNSFTQFFLSNSIVIVTTVSQVNRITEQVTSVKRWMMRSGSWEGTGLMIDLMHIREGQICSV